MLWHKQRFVRPNLKKSFPFLTDLNYLACVIHNITIFFNFRYASFKKHTLEFHMHGMYM